tara:strand:+ start:4616 stop:5233 length:618 start_codon:yes stop_codon:yes gene_type:complete
MKSGLLIFSLVALFGLNAQAQNADLLCNSSESRLSLTPKECVGLPAINYDIPTLKLQLEDIRKILQGAESSGGRLAPSTQNNPTGMANILLPTHECQAKLLLDAGHRVSWLLVSDFEITRNVAAVIPEHLWDSGLVLGNNINGDQYPLDELPQWGLQNLSVEVNGKALTICANSSCSTNESGLKTMLTQYHAAAKLQFKVSCNKL